MIAAVGIGGLGQVVRNVHREADRRAVFLAEPHLEQRRHAARDLEPVHQRRVARGQAGRGGVRGHAQRAGVRRAHRDAVEADRQPDPHPGGHVPHRLGEALPLVVRLRAGEQQELAPGGVLEQVNGQLGGFVGLPVVPGEDHRRPPGPVVDQPVHVEPGDLLVFQRAQQMGGQQFARRPGVDEPVEVVQHHCPVQHRRARAHLVEVSRISHHAHCPSRVSVGLPSTGYQP